MKDFLKRLTSRKFLLALGAFITLMASEQYTEAMGVVLGYLGMNSVSELAGRKG